MANSLMTLTFFRRPCRFPCEGSHHDDESRPHRRSLEALESDEERDRRRSSNTIFDNITDALAKGDKVSCGDSAASASDTGTRARAAIRRTGSAVDVPQKRVPFFKVGKRLRELVNA